ncbi:MAG: hypothetical protein GX637_07130 [Clostridiales bacterium]|nr:hypothetical protein [Clostridiales bacterium]
MMYFYKHIAYIYIIERLFPPLVVVACRGQYHLWKSGSYEHFPAMQRGKRGPALEKAAKIWYDKAAVEEK